MKKKNENMKNNLFKEIFLWSLLILGSAALGYLLIPEVYAFFMSLLSVSVNVFSGVVIGGAILGIVTLLGLTTKCIEIKTEYEFVNTDNLDQNADLMREKLRVVNSNDLEIEKESSEQRNKFSYVFDNNYGDTDDVMIDDITYPRMMMVVDDSYSRKKTKYKGRYLR